MSIKYIDLFAGVGGFHYGIDKAWEHLQVRRSSGNNLSLNGNKSNNSNIIRRTPYSDGMRIRRLTPVECERLQGFPDNWTKYGQDNKEMSDTQRYKQLGNAVTTTVVQAIMEKLQKCL